MTKWNPTLKYLYAILRLTRMKSMDALLFFCDYQRIDFSFPGDFDFAPRLTRLANEDEMWLIGVTEEV